MIYSTGSNPHNITPFKEYIFKVSISSIQILLLIKYMRGIITLEKGLLRNKYYPNIRIIVVIYLQPNYFN